MIAEVSLFSNKEVSVIEVEREDRALSTLICYISNQSNKHYYHHQVFNGLIDRLGTWDKEQMNAKNMNFLTLRHGKKDVEHRARKIMEKFNLI
ncbi:hypothetical protein P9E76_00405 [Schinkia azotoformans]|uniref:TnsE C-terminal domain-containing protein n=1 Tax=Schinkia azotoformans LMG 9581 TaxID=1131731 RepID=K6DCY4_SCHAZ|nr:hypothetical protein [Schinkia azotoformans]EKN70402.1 hypothetical protein BAZO_01352 [Schinkia azotoformans LMG 9581]MEC1640109.1 hypothetical protein [Schinkia azotoformans]MEC1943547.1 hypothetical protein [Schinkia azotoformans]